MSGGSVLDVIVVLFYRVSYTEISGTLYKKGSCVLYTFDDDTPIFGKVYDIVVTMSGNCLFILIPYVGNAFYHHFNAYEVHPTSSYIVCQQRDFVK